MGYFWFEFTRRVLLPANSSVVTLDVCSYFLRKFFAINGVGYFVVGSKWELGQEINVKERDGIRKRAGAGQSKSVDYTRIKKVLKAFEKLGLSFVEQNTKVINKVFECYVGATNYKNPTVYNVTGFAIVKLFFEKLELLRTSRKVKTKRVAYSVFHSFLELLKGGAKPMEAVYEALTSHRAVLTKIGATSLLSLRSHIYKLSLNRKVYAFSQKNRSATTQATS